MRVRRSVRSFRDKPVPRDELARLLDVARYAPSGSNRQPVSWLVVYDTAEVKRLAGMVEDSVLYSASQQVPAAATATVRQMERARQRGLDLICRGAPHLVVAHTPKGAGNNGVIALTYLELAAYSLGLGACWGGFFTGAAQGWGPLQQALGLPEGHVVCGAMLVGYPKYRYRRIPVRNEARVTWR